MPNRFGTVVFALYACVASSACSDDDTRHADQRGALLQTYEVASLETSAVQDYLGKFGLNTTRARFGVAAYRIIYATVDATGAATTASALIALPRSAEETLPAAVWMHGTTVFRGEAASVNDESSDRAAAFLFAAAGYATTAPDYLGLGAGPGTHPYDDADTEVSAAVDALSAARQFLKKRGTTLEPQVHVSGHSQGARASLELGRALQEGALPGMRLGALAPISGPYDMSYTLAVAVSDGIAFTTGYVSYLVVAWNRLHHLYATPSEAFLPPYDATIETLFDNDHLPEVVLGALPDTVEELFTPAFLRELRKPTGALLAALGRADAACRFTSSVPVHLFAASGDLDVPISNAEHCLVELERHDTSVKLVDVGEVDHSASANLALPRVLDLFDASAR